MFGNLIARIRARWPEFERETRRRAVRGGVVGGAAFLVLALTGAASLSLVFTFAVALGLYVPAWNRLPRGRWVVVIGVVLIAVMYPFYQVNMFEMPIFGEFPSVDTGVTIAR